MSQEANVPQPQEGLSGYLAPGLQSDNPKHLDAYSLAWQANEFYDEREEAATALAGQDESLINVEVREQRFDQAASRFDRYVRAAEVLMPPIAAYYETSGSVEPLTPEVPAPAKLEVSVFDTLTPEKQERARKETAALAEKFNRPPSDFSVIRYVNEAGKEVTRVALTATEGHDLGDPEKVYDSKRNWDETLKQQKDGQFVFEVDGEQIDSLADSDSQYLEAVAAANPKINEAAWRIAEKHKADRHYAPFADLSDGRVYVYQDYRSYDRRYLRVRPAGGDLS